MRSPQEADPMQYTKAKKYIKHKIKAGVSARSGHTARRQTPMPADEIYDLWGQHVRRKRNWGLAPALPWANAYREPIMLPAKPRKRFVPAHVGDVGRPRS